MIGNIDVRDSRRIKSHLNLGQSKQSVLDSGNTDVHLHRPTNVQQKAS
jgi:hypothetical protein